MKKKKNFESNQDQSHSLDDVRCDDEDDEDDDDSYYDEEQAPPAAKVIASTGNTVSGQSTITHSASGGTLSMRQGTAKSVHIQSKKKNTHKTNFQTIRCLHCFSLFVLITLDLFMIFFCFHSYNLWFVSEILFYVHNLCILCRCAVDVAFYLLFLGVSIFSASVTHNFLFGFLHTTSGFYQFVFIFITTKP